jgi:hypothetical protein
LVNKPRIPISAQLAVTSSPHDIAIFSTHMCDHRSKNKARSEFWCKPYTNHYHGNPPPPFTSPWVNA